MKLNKRVFKEIFELNCTHISLINNMYIKNIDSMPLIQGFWDGLMRIETELAEEIDIKLEE